jgi:hypothetical protein
MALSIQRFSRTTGTLIGAYTGPVLSVSSTARLYGGSDKCELVIPFISGESLPINPNEELTLSKDGQPLFAGVVSHIEPNTKTATQSVHVSGWFYQLDSIQAVPIPGDRLAFGVAPPDDAPFPQLFFPQITTVRQVITYLADNIILAGTNNRVALGELDWAPVSCRLAGEFSVYSNDSLSKVLETLAMMDDCAIGVSADRKLYVRHRGTLESRSPYITIQAAGSTQSAIQSGRGILIDGTQKLLSDTPTQVGVFSRDTDGNQSVRVYRDITDGVSDRPVRRANISARQIRSGYQARRLARGTLRRYANLPMEWKDAQSYFKLTQRLEPHLGTTRIVDGSNTPYSTGLASLFDTTWLPSIQCKVTIGESDADPGAGGPNDPLDSGPPIDDPAVDTGTGTEELPDPSSDIDLDDAFDGDGDGFHYDGPLSVDYGSDFADPTNRPGSGSGGTGLTGQELYLALWPAKVTAIDGTGPEVSYKLTLYRPDGEPSSLPGNVEPVSGQVPSGVFDGCLAYPEPVNPYSVNDLVWAAFVPLDGGEAGGLSGSGLPTVRQQFFANSQPLPGVLVRFRELAGGRKAFVLSGSDGYASAKVNPGFIQVSVIQWPFQNDPAGGPVSDTVLATGSGTITVDSVSVTVAGDNPPRTVSNSSFNSSPYIVALQTPSTSTTEYPLGRMLHGPAEGWGGVIA